jgi:hypothetical protein
MEEKETKETFEESVIVEGESLADMKSIVSEIECILNRKKTVIALAAIGFVIADLEELVPDLDIETTLRNIVNEVKSKHDGK